MFGHYSPRANQPSIFCMRVLGLAKDSSLGVPRSSLSKIFHLQEKIQTLHRHVWTLQSKSQPILHFLYEGPGISSSSFQSSFICLVSLQTIEMLHSCSVVQVGAVSGPLNAPDPQNQAYHNLEVSESICGDGEIPLPTGLEGFPKVPDTFSLQETWLLEEANFSINIMDSVIHSVLNLSTARSSNEVSVQQHHGSGLHQASRSLTGEGEANQIMVWAELHVPFLCALYIPGMQNWKAHLNSRQCQEPGEWSLHPRGFEALCHRWGMWTSWLPGSTTN